LTKNELNSFAEISKGESSTSSFKSIVAANNDLTQKSLDWSVKSWDSKSVRSWLRERKIDDKITEMLGSFDGEMLEELNHIRNNSANYFYSHLSQNNISFFEVVKFSKELKKLFA
jgi:hypothetical protein